jgi:hypothetical protein
MGFSGGDGNLSRYVHNNATTFTDPTGLDEASNIEFGRQRQKEQLTWAKEDLQRHERWLALVEKNKDEMGNTLFQDSERYDQELQAARQLVKSSTKRVEDLELVISNPKAAMEKEKKEYAETPEQKAYRRKLVDKVNADYQLVEIPGFWESLGDGLGDGVVIGLNRLTGGHIDSLDEKAKRLIRENGGLYETADDITAAGSEVLHTLGPGRVVKAASKGFKALKIGDKVIKAEHVVDAVGVGAEALKGVDSVRERLKQGDVRGAREEAVKALVGVMLGPQARERADAALQIRRALEKGDTEGAAALVKGQVFKEVDSALDNLKACDVEALAGDALRVREAVKAAESVKRVADAIQKEDWKGAATAAIDAAERLDKLGDPCFVAGTPFRTPEGHKSVEEFGEGDRILTREENNPNAPVVVRIVEQVFVRSAEVHKLRANGKLIGTTSEHPFWVKEKGWTPVRELRPGDLLSTQDGSWLAVEEVYGTGDWQTVYNLRVAEHHTYFVGADDWGFSLWAHNACHEKADAATRPQGEHFRAQAQKFWDTLPDKSRYGATIAVTEVNGKQVVSLYANVGAGERQFTQRQIDQFLKSVEAAGGIALHTSGQVHAEQELHNRYPTAPAIGISNPKGPCDKCLDDFENNRKYFNLFWPDRQ